MSTVGVDETDPPLSWAEAIRSAPEPEPGPWRQRGLKAHPQCPGSPQASKHRTKQKPLQPTCASLTNFFTLRWEGRGGWHSTLEEEPTCIFHSQQPKGKTRTRVCGKRVPSGGTRSPGTRAALRAAGAGRRERSRRALTLCGMEAAGSPCPHTSFSFSPPWWAARTSSFERVGESDQIALLS